MGATGAFGGTPYGAMQRVRGVPTWVAETHVSAATGGSGGAPYGATKHAMGVPGWVAGTHVSAATGAFGGAPYGATKRVSGVPEWRRNGGEAAMRTLPLGPSVELPVGPRNV